MPAPKKSPEKALAKEVRRLTDIIQARGRLRRRFLSGLFFGVGSAIGATVVAGIIIYIIASILKVVGIMPTEIDPSMIIQE